MCTYGAFSCCICGVMYIWHGVHVVHMVLLGYLLDGHHTLVYHTIHTFCFGSMLAIHSVSSTCSIGVTQFEIHPL